MSKSGLEQESGATFVEIAIALPIFMFFILIIIWVGITVNASSSLEAALSRGLRLAVTRGDRASSGTAVIDDIADFHQSGVASGHLQSLLTQGDVDWRSGASSHYDSQIQRIFPGYSLDTLPESYTYFYVYFLESLRHNIGDSFKALCDPRPSDDPLSGNGCVTCVPLNPSRYDSTDRENGFYEITPFDGEIPGRRLGFRCEYQPDVFLLTPIVRLLGMLVGQQNVPVIILRSQELYEA